VHGVSRKYFFSMTVSFTAGEAGNGNDSALGRSRTLQLGMRRTTRPLHLTARLGVWLQPNDVGGSVLKSPHFSRPSAYCTSAIHCPKMGRPRLNGFVYTRSCLVQIFNACRRGQGLFSPQEKFALEGHSVHGRDPEVAEGQPHGLSSMRRIMSGMSTVMLDLNPSLEELRAQLDRRWRHRLVGGESSEMTIHRVGTNVGQYRWVLDAEIQQRTDKKLEGLPIPFFDNYVHARKQPAQNILTLRADLGRDRIAAMMFLIHGTAATYQVGWTSEKGRDMHAHNLILWRGIEELKSRGIRMLDLGGVNTIRSAGIARFKMSTGGKVLTLAGSYI
jgi:hypothetical protein